MLVSANSSRPSSRADRRLRFAELEPDDVHVYESAPPSPKQKTLALPPPGPEDAGSSTSLGTFRRTLVPGDAVLTGHKTSEPDEPEEGTSEDIRRRFFPNAPMNDPNLAWMRLESSDAEDTPLSSLRFDLKGNPIPATVSLSLPTHLGLHHHSEGTRAGYTLEDIFLLSRSTVPAQRATMLGILRGISHRLGKLQKNGDAEGMEELVGKEEELKGRILAAGVHAMADRGSVGVVAIEVIWECVVGWDHELENLNGIELESRDDSSINNLPMDQFLQQITTTLTQGAVPQESSRQLLSIIRRLAMQNNKTAEKIVVTPQLVPAVLQTFLLTPIPLQDNQAPADPLALQLLCTLAEASRSNSRELEKYADALLRFVSFSPFHSPLPLALATNLLVSTLDFYSALASYGIYTHIASTAMSQLAEVERYIISEACSSVPLRIAWCKLISIWITCAIDPHQTSPPHDIVWTHITSWAWQDNIMELQAYLSVAEKDWMVWSSSWAAQAAWLEGAKINAIKGGEIERTDFINCSKTGFDNGSEHEVVLKTLNDFRNKLDEYVPGDCVRLGQISRDAEVLTSVIRLWLSCIPPHADGPPQSPPLMLPFNQIAEVAQRLLHHDLWSTMVAFDSSPSCVHCRKISGFLVQFLRLSRRLPSTTQNLWMAQAFSILLRVGPGDEASAEAIIKDLIDLVTPQWAGSIGIVITPAVWERSSLLILEPFLKNIIRPDQDTYVGPLIPTPQSIQSATTQRLPAQNSEAKIRGLPLYRDWTTVPVDHLLRSGDSPVFKALPIGWDSSEVEVTRASLLFTLVAQKTLYGSSITESVLSNEEGIMGCMKVFMLEHNQSQNDSAEEVFRDPVVNRLMQDILFYYTQGYNGPRAHSHDNLEKVAQRFLGPSTPFFQFYTDFVALYDAISFSHPVFGSLLLPPTSMHYPPDYRKHLWVDFNHVLRTVRPPISNVLSSNIRDYLYPVESDSQILAAYLNSLLKDNVYEFTRLVALHHIAANIWPDLHESESENDVRAASLLKAVVNQGGIDIIRQVVQYRQTSSGSVLLPPQCFSPIGEANSVRLRHVEIWGGQTMVEKLRGLLH